MNWVKQPSRKSKDAQEEVWELKNTYVSLFYDVDNSPAWIVEIGRIDKNHDYVRENITEFSVKDIASRFAKSVMKNYYG